MRQQIRLTRRALVKGSGGLFALAGLGALLTACSSGSATPTASQPAAPTAIPAATIQPSISPPTPAPVATNSTAATPAATTLAAGQPVYGGELRATLGAEPETMDPHKSGSLFANDVRANLFDGLVDNDTSYGPKPGLADSWDSPDAKVWTFHLHAGVTFHDGSPLTAEVVKGTFDRILDPKTGASARTQIDKNIDTISLPDDHTLTFTLKAPNAAFPNLLRDVKIVPKNFDATNPIGTGPFQFVEWIRNQHVKLKKNPNYFVKGLPYLDGVTFQPVPDEDQKVTLLQTGQVDFIDTVPLPRIKEVQQGGKIQVFPVAPGVSPAYYWMPVNGARPPLNDARVRQAMNLAIDRKALLEVTFGVGVIRADLIPPKHWAFNPQTPSFAERDVARAKTLLADAGQSGGFPIELRHITSRAEYASLAQVFQANMADIGIKVTIIPMEIGVWIQQVQVKHDYQIGMTGNLPDSDPDSIFAVVDPKLPGGAVVSYKNDKFEQLLQQGRAVVSQDARKTFYFQAQDIFAQDSPGFVINERPILSGASPAVQGFVQNVNQNTMFARIWLKR